MVVCESCGIEFPRGWSDAEAQAEYERNFPEDAARRVETGLVCTPCYDKLRQALALAERLKSIGLCGQMATFCVCSLPAGHGADAALPHVCPCGGIWTGSMESDDFTALALPSIMLPVGWPPPPTSHDVRMN